MSERSNTKKNNIRHLYSLIKKNLKLIVRDKLLFSLTLLAPIIFISLFSVSMQLTEGTDIYTLGILNMDDDGVELPHANLSARVSFDFISVFSDLSQLDEKTLQFNIIENYGGNPINSNSGRILCDDAVIDAFIVIPVNFSETIIGATWWYNSLNASDFENLNDLIESIGLDSVSVDTALLLLNNTNFPLNATPQLSIYINPEILSKNIISNVISKIVDNLILVYNNVKLAEISIENRNNVEKSLTQGDSILPRYAMISGLIPIISAAILIVKEKESKTISLEDSTHVLRIVNFLSIFISQLIITMVQTPILIGGILVSGLYTNPFMNFFDLYLLLILYCSISISIGIIIGILSQSSDSAGLMSTILTIVFLTLGGTFIKLDNVISYWIPTYYANMASNFIITEGKDLGFTFPYFGILMVFGIVFFIIAAVHFQKKKFEEIN